MSGSRGRRTINQSLLPTAFNGLTHINAQGRTIITVFPWCRELRTSLLQDQS
jgi:hypothetical protein